jgi:hypothetical protein
VIVTSLSRVSLGQRSLLETMSKRSLSPPTLPPAKRAHLEYKISINDHVDFACLSDEVVIHVFRYLSWIDLCAIQPATRTISRLALDNQVHTTMSQDLDGQAILNILPVMPEVMEGAVFSGVWPSEAFRSTIVGQA